MPTSTSASPTRSGLPWRRILIAAAVVAVGIQLVPYGHRQQNPPVVAEPSWDRPETRVLFMRTCGDCHSHETQWPWYAKVAPVSWLTVHDVEEGREHFNVSRFGVGGEKDADEAVEMVESGEMPLWFYTPLHAEARLAPADRQALLAGMAATFGVKRDKR